jgi:hypothetical protein
LHWQHLGFFFPKLFTLSPQELNDFPNYLFVYWMHLVNAPLTCIVLLLLCYARNDFMRKTMIRELKDFLRIQNVYWHLVSYIVKYGSVWCFVICCKINKINMPRSKELLISKNFGLKIKIYQKDGVDNYWWFKIWGKGQNYENQNIESQQEHQKFEKDQKVKVFYCLF